MKKLTALILISLILLTGGLSVSASTATVSLLQLRLEAKEKALEIRENRLENKLVWVSNATLRVQIKSKLVTIKADGTLLDAALITQIQTLTTQLKTKYAALNATKGQIAALTANVPALIQAKNWTELKTVYDSVLLVQQTRNGLLTDINDLLNRINDLLP